MALYRPRIYSLMVLCSFVFTLHVQAFTNVSMFHNKDKFRLLNLVKIKLVMKHTLRSLLMLVKQDACRLNNTAPFLCTVSCNVDTVECIIFVGKGIPSKKHAKFCLLSLYFAVLI